MAQPYVGEIRMFAGNFPPVGWLLCAGQLLPISENEVLFQLIGTTYGGNGQTTFGLPDLRGRTPIHSAQNHYLGEKGGQEAHTLTIAELPTHVHAANATNNGGTTNTVSGNVLSNLAPNELYVGASSLVALNPATITNVGGSQAHQNMQPYLVLNFCIALQGIFPSQN